MDNLITCVDALSCEDDGIKMNQKLKHIQKFIEKDCTTVEHLCDSFGELNTCCLKDAEFGVKVAILIASSTFSTLEMFGMRLRNLLLRELQGNFENARDLLESNADQFYNSLNLIGEYYNRGRLLNNKPIELLVDPILKYLQLCLEAKSARGAKALVTQLSLNGSLIKSSHGAELDKLMIDVRKALLESNEIPIKIWLMLTIDIVGNHFEINKDYDEFYVDMIKKYELESSEIPKSKSEIEPEIQKNSTIEIVQEITEKTNGRQNEAVLKNQLTNIDNGSEQCYSSSQPKINIGDRLKADHFNTSTTTPVPLISKTNTNLDSPINKNMKNSTSLEVENDTLKRPESKNTYSSTFANYLNKT